MAKTEPETSSEAPFGSSRRPAWPLALFIVLFAAWFVFLAWMAIQYPAR